MNRVGKIVPPKRHILKDISLSFFPGAKIGVLGTNGSGKSTLLKIMAGIDKEIEGEAIPMAGLKIGYLPQEPIMDAEFTPPTPKKTPTLTPWPPSRPSSKPSSPPRVTLPSTSSKSPPTRCVCPHGTP